jgi:hypothetical protein
MKKLLKEAACAAAIFLAGAFVASAQPYFTNNAPQSGAYQYNQNCTQPLQPSKTLAQQYQAGILAGTTNCYASYYNLIYFPTNIYNTPPIVTVTSSATNAIISVIYTTTSNFMFGVTVTNIVTTNYWEAIGH